MIAPKPVRVRLSRQKGWRMPENTVKVDRTTRWGNHDFVVGEYHADAGMCVEMFHHDLDKCSVFHPDQYEAYLAPLRGKNLACWCALDAPCHADVLLELANDAGQTQHGYAGEAEVNPSSPEPVK
jgi:hypothetical protein